VTNITPANYNEKRLKMKDPITNVCVSFQCPMDWKQLQEKSNTERFCTKCQHAVKDFTNASKQEFEEVIAASPTRVCGRFRKSQMDIGYLKRIAATVVVAASIVACTPEPLQPSPMETAISKDVMEEEEIFLGIFLEVTELDTLHFENKKIVTDSSTIKKF
jgi:leucyl aminopeptidase